MEALKPEPKPLVVRSDGHFTKPWPAKIKVPKPPKAPRAIQDAQWLLGCFTEASMGQGVALLAQVVKLAGLRGPRLGTALACFKLNGAIEIVDRGEGAVMRIPAVVANCSPRVLSHL